MTGAEQFHNRHVHFVGHRFGMSGELSARVRSLLTESHQHDQLAINSTKQIILDSELFAERGYSRKLHIARQYYDNFDAGKLYLNGELDIDEARTMARISLFPLEQKIFDTFSNRLEIFKEDDLIPEERRQLSGFHYFIDVARDALLRPREEQVEAYQRAVTDPMTLRQHEVRLIRSSQGVYSEPGSMRVKIPGLPPRPRRTGDDNDLAEAS